MSVRGNQSWSAREDGGLRCKEARGVGLAGLVRLMSWRRPLVAHLGAKKPNAPVLDTSQAVDVVPCMRIKVVDKTPDMVHANGDRSYMHSLSIHRMTIGEARGIHNGDEESARRRLLEAPAASRHLAQSAASNRCLSSTTRSGR